MNATLSNDRKALTLVGAAVVASITSTFWFGVAMSYDAPGSFSSVAQDELQVPELSDLTAREVQLVGRDLCGELLGEGSNETVDQDALADALTRRYTISRSTARDLIDAALTHLCPEAASPAPADGSRDS